MGELSKLPNIGTVLEKELNEISIMTVEQLKSLGSKEVFIKIKIKDPTACINKLYAIEGAIQGIRWHNLSDEKKQELKAFYKTL